MPDQLTGLALNSELNASVADTEPPALIVDIDGLSCVNHAFGREAGDSAITTVAAELVRAVAAFARADVLRVRGDTFLVLLPSFDGDALLDFAHEIVERIRALAIPYRTHEDPSRSVLDVNVTALQLTPYIFQHGFAGHMMSDGLDARIANLTYRQKRRTGGRSGVVVEVRSERWLREDMPDSWLCLCPETPEFTVRHDDSRRAIDLLWTALPDAEAISFSSSDKVVTRPSGLGRFELKVENPGSSELRAEDLAAVEAALGVRLRLVWCKSAS